MPQFCSIISALLCCLLLTSCSSTKAPRSKANDDLLRLTGFWQPHQMHLLGSPHPRLYVELDAVEGYSPSEDTLNNLRHFLATYCHKPGGIELVRSDVIPLKHALGTTPSALARKYLNGPPENMADSPPAFLYVLFFSDALSDRRAVIETGHLGARAAPRSRLPNRNPHVDMLPYPAMIYMNEHWAFKSLHSTALLHEAGHVLGLAFRPTNAFAGHCQTRFCLMAEKFDLTALLLGLDHGKQGQLCDRCLAQLAASRAQSPPSNLRFIGPVLVRSEPGYQVLCLPHRIKVILGNLAEQDCRDFAVAVRAETPSPRGHESDWRVDFFAREENVRDLEKVHELINRISVDPDPLARRVAPKLWLICAHQYNARGQFTNAVDTCRQVILADPNEDQGHNLLAWIRAVCSDASVRDGKEAVSAATKACELTQWKQWGWIDTLAAAWAEAGDFKRALQFQRQALRTGHPPEADLKDMQERFSLYQQSRPFREKGPSNR